MHPQLKVAIPAILLGLQLWSHSAFAEPTLYPTNVSVLSSIINKTNSNILADEVDPKTIWVMPPNTATAKVSGMHTPTANMGYCAEMRDLQTYTRDLSAQINDLMKLKKSKTQELLALEDKASALDQAAQKFAADRNLSALSELDTRIGSAEIRLTELYALQDRCTNNCEQIEVEVSDLIKAKAEMLKQRNVLAKENTADIRAYNKMQKEAVAAKNRYISKRQVFTDLAGEIQTMQNQFKAAYASFGKMEGARAGIKYKSTWDDNVTALREANPGFNIQKIKTQNAQLMTELSGLENVDAGSAILGMPLPGFKDGLAKYPAYPESLTTNVVLSLVGACPMAHPEYFDLGQVPLAEMSYGMIITYDYQTIFKMKASVKYNMYKMYQKIVSSGSRGGLFSSRSWSNVEEKNIFQDSFIVKWDDRENSVPQEEKEEREKEMRHAVLLRLATQAIPDSPSRVELLQAVAPGPHGAIVLADALTKTCGFNVYCQGGAIVMRVLDAIFGSSSTSSSYTKITNSDLEENYEVQQKITKSWITTYL